jgi:galactokinase
MMAHHEKMKQHRNNLEKRVAECEKSSGQLAVEDELRELKDSKKEVEESLAKALENGAKFKTDLNEAKDELKVMRATKLLLRMLKKPEQVKFCFCVFSTKISSKLNNLCPYPT